MYSGYHHAGEICFKSQPLNLLSLNTLFCQKQTCSSHLPSIDQSWVTIYIFTVQGSTNLNIASPFVLRPLRMKEGWLIDPCSLNVRISAELVHAKQ